MPFDAESAVLVAPDAPAAESTGKFQPDSAQPVGEDHKAVEENFKAQWENSKSWVDRLGIYGKYFSHPLARYEQSVEQSFQRPAVLGEIPKIETTKDTNIVGQATAPLANAATGLVEGLQTAGGASVALNPVALAYATPYFAAKTWEEAKKTFHDFTSAVKGGDVSTGTLAADVVGTAMNTLAAVGGGRHAVKGVKEMVEAVKKPVEAQPEPPILKPTFDSESAKPVAPAEEAKPAAEPASTPKFDAETAKPVEAKAPDIEEPKFDAPPPVEAPPVIEETPVEEPTVGAARPLSEADRAKMRAEETGNLSDKNAPTFTLRDLLVGKRDALAEAGLKRPIRLKTPSMVGPYAGEHRMLMSQNGAFGFFSKDGVAEDQLVAKLQELGFYVEHVNDAYELVARAMRGEEIRPEGGAAANTTDFRAGMGSPVSDPVNYGVAARVSDARASGNLIEPVEPGEGISAEDSVKHGRRLIAEGASPDSALADFEETKQISADSVALVRAHGEQLAKAAYEALDKHGEDSPEYKAAAQADSDWVKRIKPMQTEWHKIGQAQQGETEIDTGNFHGIRRGFVEATGRDFTPEEATKAKEIVGKVQEANTAAEVAKQKVVEAIANGDAVKGPRRNRIVQALSDRADAARERIKARMAEGRVSSGLDPLELKDYAEVAAYHLARGVEAAAELVKEFGEKIRPHLEEILAKARETVAEESKPLKSDTTAEAIWQRAKTIIDAGETDFDEVRHKIANDLGIPVEDVTKKLTENKTTRTMANDMYAKLAARREVVSAAKNWVKEANTPGWLKFTQSVPRAFFAAKVFGHGTVGMVTHAGLNVFHPEAWRTYWPAFFQQFKLLGMHDKGAYHERMMEDLRRDPNFITAKRAGLAVDPHKYVDDYQNTRIGGWLRKSGLTGNRGFDALKLFRMARFNQVWEAMPPDIKTPDNAKLVADSINHATGVVKMRFGEWSNWTFFAPKLEGSRWAWMIADPLRAAKTLSAWDKATPAEQQFAIREVKQKAYITGVYLSLLAVNQGLLSAVGSAQKVNFTDPRKSDFLSFKVAGHNFGVVGPMVGIVRLFANLLHASVGDRDKFEKMTSRSDEIAGTLKDYGRGKLSPFAAVATDVITQSDFQKRPLPFSNDKVPTYLRRDGVKKYTWGEYAAINLTPIPVSEAVREVWRKQGMDESDIEHWMKALTSAVVMGGTGARMSPDNRIKK